MVVWKWTYLFFPQCRGLLLSWVFGDGESPLTCSVFLCPGSGIISPLVGYLILEAGVLRSIEGKILMCLCDLVFLGGSERGP